VGLALLLIAGPGLIAAGAGSPRPFVSPLFGSNMILQRGQTNRIWGWGKPGETVRVELAGPTVAGTADASGRWQVQLVPPAAAGPLTLGIFGSQTVVFTNILAGDVWLCGGQSNMEFPLEKARNGDAEVKAADHPDLRLFTVKSQAAYAPADLAPGSWKVCTPQTVTQDGGVSAVAYFFARRVQGETNIPIGLIKDCWGGTTAESWTSADALRPLHDFDTPLAIVERLRAQGGPQYGNYIAHWYDEFDAGQKNEAWFRPDLDDHDWKTVSIPGGFSELGVPATPAVCYFRRTVVLPDPVPAGAASIHLGVVERMDTTYLNGHWLGASAWVENPRVYPIGDGVLQPGTNTIVVRVLKTRPDGGFRSQPGDLKLVLGNQGEIPLAGEWRGKLSVDARPPHPLPYGCENWPTMPAVLYNGMIAPVAPFALSGALWYQGEANAERAAQYRKLLPAMIADWRRAFGRGDFPFYLVSLPGFMRHQDVPGDAAWAELREAQAFTARDVTNCGLAVAIDVGEADNIHPADKKPVGERLALCALANYYGRPVVSAGPAFDRLEELPGALRLRFQHTEGGLVAKGGQPGEFSVAGDDGQWFWAEARIDRDSVIVSSGRVPRPKAARYAWQSNPQATLFNGAGLPAVPFRTDFPQPTIPAHTP
jgi:sialate O-acetylesterase